MLEQKSPEVQTAAQAGPKRINVLQTFLKVKASECLQKILIPSGKAPLEGINKGNSKNKTTSPEQKIYYITLYYTFISA